MTQPLPANSSKLAWRRWAKGARAGLPTPTLSAQITAQLSASPLFGRARHVLCYLAFGSEVDLSALLGPSATPPTKTFYAPRTARGGLTVHRLGGELELHRYGFLQPADVAAVDPGVLELVLIPGLAFDRLGTRLGYGGGFYDRLLPLLRSEVPRVGVVPDALIVDALPREAHDVRVTHLLSEKGLRALR